MNTGNRADDRNPGGRPRIGPPAKWALPRELRTALAAARRTRPDGTRESEAAAARRLLAAALNPSVAAALRMAAAAYDNGTAEPCRQLADELRDLADQLT